MKYNKLYIAGILAMAASFSACETEEPSLFANSDNGVYFDYDNPEELQASRNFADYIIENPDTLGIPVKIKLLGQVSDNSRNVVLKGKPMDNYQEAEFDSLPRTVTFAPGEYEKTVMIYAKRPKEDDTQYATKLYLESQDNLIGSGIEGFEEFTVYVSTTYTKPENWEYNALQDFFGDWSKEKHVFLAQWFESNDYANENPWTFCDAQPGIVNYLREHPETDLEIPFYYNSNYYMTYSRPAYWGSLQDKYLGNWNPYNSNTFAQIAYSAGVTTKTEKEFFTGDEAKMKEVNKIAVGLMQQVYNSLFLREMPVQNYDMMFWVPMFADVDYDVIQPACWSDEMPDANAMISKYYGTYSADKLKFMIKTAVEVLPEDATLIKMFPIRIMWDDKAQSYLAEWDGLYDENWINYTPGEDLIYKMNVAFRQADTTNKYNFPVVEASNGDGGKKEIGKKQVIRKG